MNVVALIGRWTKEHELRYSQNGTAVLKNSLAVNRPFSKNKETDFFDITIFGKIAENTANYTKKGMLVGIEGRLQQNRWEDQQGNKRSKVEVIATAVEFLEFADGNNKKDETGIMEIDGFMALDDTDDVPF